MRIRTLPLLASIFGTLLALIIFTSACVFVKSAELQDKFAGAEQRYHRAANLLISVRSDIYASMFTVQQYLLDPNNGARERSLEELSKIKQLSGSHLADAGKLFPVSDQLNQLRDELTHHWNSLDGALRPAKAIEPASGRLSEGTAAFADALRATRDMDEINNAYLLEEQLELERDRRSFGRFLLWVTSLTVALGLGVSIAALAGLRRLERQSENERVKTRQAEFELRRLSQQLVKAQEEERKNISRELHDEVGQLLTGLRIGWAICSAAMARHRPSRVEFRKLKGWLNKLCARFATWPCCCVLRCWTTRVLLRLCGGRPRNSRAGLKFP